MKRLTSSTLILIFTIWLLLVLGCSGSDSTNNPATSASTSKLPTYDLDMAGQVRRLRAEGLDEESVRENIKAADTKITYQLEKNAAKHAGKPWAFTGTILEIQEDNDNTIARISLDSWGNKAVFVAAPISTDFVKNNRVYVVGYLAGAYSYESQAGWNITIPALAARAILKPNDAAKIKGKK